MNESKEKATSHPESRLSTKSIKMQFCAAFPRLSPPANSSILNTGRTKSASQKNPPKNDWLSVTRSLRDLDDDDDNSSSECFFFFFQSPSEFPNSLRWVGLFLFSPQQHVKKKKKIIKKKENKHI